MVVDNVKIIDDVRCGGTHARVLMKGNQTKRQRPMSPFDSRISTSCSSSAGGAEEGGDAATTSNDSTMISSSEEEEKEDMAHCLILLAQSDGSSSQKFLPFVSTAVTMSGFNVHECKTCNRVFPSFQALGGHRASHKKLKLLPLMTVEPAAHVLTVHDFDAEERQFRKTALLPHPLRLARKTPTHGVTSISSTKQKVHECSICGSEFGSGQALGGHMRRHRTNPASRSSDAASASNSPVSDEKLSRNVLPLDLNLPAPEDDQMDSKFGFRSTEQLPIHFPGPALVNCHL